MVLIGEAEQTWLASSRAGGEQQSGRGLVEEEDRDWKPSNDSPMIRAVERVATAMIRAVERVARG